MKKIPFPIAFIAFSVVSLSQTKMFINKVDGTSDSVSLSQIKSITFKAPGGVVPSEGLVAYYPFNGNPNDESGNGNNGTVIGATLTTDRFGNPNRAYYFNGSGSYITIAHDNSIDFPNTHSICAWIKFEVGGTYNPRIVHKTS